MVRIFLVVLAFMSTPAFSKSFSFSCQLKDFVILAMEDGKTQRYTGFTDSYTVGDTFRIEMKLGDKLGKPTLEGSVTSGGKERMMLFPVTLEQKLVKKGDTIRIDELISEYAVGEDYFEIEALFNTLTLRRYYKGDWQGIFKGEDIGENSFSSYVGTFNCLGASSAIDTLYTRVFELTKP